MVFLFLKISIRYEYFYILKNPLKRQSETHVNVGLQYGVRLNGNVNLKYYEIVMVKDWFHSGFNISN